MAELTTYQNLEDQVVRWLAETSPEIDLRARIPDFIDLMEDGLNNDPEFRLREMQISKTTVPSLGETSIELPGGFLQMDYLTVTTSPEKPPLTYVSPRDLASKTTDNGFVEFYSIINEEIRVYPAFGSNETLEMGYYETIPKLSSAQTTTWLFSKSAPLYLYGTLMQAEPYLHNDDRVATWNALFREAKQALIDMSQAEKTSGGPMVVGLPVNKVA